MDIPRATLAGRKIRFSHYKNGRVYYDTAFGESFYIHDYNVPTAGISRVEEASDFISQIEHFNANHTGSGS